MAIREDQPYITADICDAYPNRHRVTLVTDAYIVLRCVPPYDEPLAVDEPFLFLLCKC